MTPQPPAIQPSEGSPGRPGRKLGPIVDGVGAAHRAWLEALRARLAASGMTVSDLAQRAGWSKSKVSELLRGAGLYPRWEITHNLLPVLGIPAAPMRRLWAAAALEAHKKQDWVQACIEKVVVATGPRTPPVNHLAFTEFNGATYTAYARTFLRNRTEADRAVTETFDLLWLRWDEALASSDVQSFAWPILRRSVMQRTPHTAGRPELVRAAFDTVVLGETADLTAQFLQMSESMLLFQAMSRLPDLQLDVMVLKHLRGRTTEAVATTLGIPIALVYSAERHARRFLTTALDPHNGPGETPQ
ncbi:helix-turn-helix domain-containing protein [Streptomyces sp. NPDC001985]|uniref:helix-turn-helix domain-containing protein n=1 Tax=Streptomyces sp. NPDC001985 TaxID=3154406 RepID=UPI0033222362